MLTSFTRIRPSVTGSLQLGQATGSPLPGLHALSHGQRVFTEGTPRHAAGYLILKGALCHYMVWPDGHHDVIEFGFPGDIVGLGSLGDHVSTAQATVDSEVVALTNQQLDGYLATDASLETKLAAAHDREFEFVRSRTLGRGVRLPLHRVAAYLVAVAKHDCRSGENSAIIADGCNAEYLANLLEIRPSDVTASFEALETGGSIRQSPDGLVICDMTGLENLSN